MPQPLTGRLEDYLRTHGVTPAAVLIRELEVSQPTFSRAVAQAGASILKIGRARATRYALLREVGRSGRRWPLYRMNEAGRAERLGVLSAISDRGFHFSPDTELPAFLHGDFADGLFPGLPWFLEPLRPQGFLGRAFARRVARTLSVSEDPTRWSAEDVLLTLLGHGDDASGDLILGEMAMQTALAALLAPADGVAENEVLNRYPVLAEEALAGEITGSSAGGEQPKFTATLAVAGGRRAVIVKFSDRIDTPAGRRWADLLLAEAVASRVLREHGLEAAASTTRNAGGRVFLESTRFDRTAGGGRSGLVPLSALDAAFYGHGSIRWQTFANQLAADGWIADDDAGRLRLLGWFGDLIANDDMHLGNVGLRLTNDRPLRLAPTYDMLPMRLRPASSGEVVPRTFEVKPPLPEQREDWHHIAPVALQFWREMRDHPEGSPGFAKIADDAARSLEAATRKI